MKPFSEACEQNKDPILEVLKIEFSRVRSVLEVGSGTGQHAVFFAAHLPHLNWQSSDVAANLSGIQQWLQEAGLSNTPEPLVLDVDDQWQISPVEAVFSANTAHIMSWSQVEKLFKHIGQVLQPNGIFCLYGPFNQDGKYTSESNARFDQWLKQRDPLSGIRDKSKLNQLATQNNMLFERDYEMPVNNQIVVWRRYSSISSTSA